MERKYRVIEQLVSEGKLASDIAAEVIDRSLQSGKPSLYHLIHDYAVDAEDVVNILRRANSDSCTCPKCDGAGMMIKGKGDGTCHLCNRQGVVPLEVAFDWLDGNRCIPGF